MSNTQSFMAGIAAATLVMFAVNITTPEPLKCEASSEAKATIATLTDALKKSMDNIAQACRK